MSKCRIPASKAIPNNASRSLELGAPIRLVVPKPRMVDAAAPGKSESCFMIKVDFFCQESV